jgi:uncharacterized membrane protein YagU involved in acid resistance
MSASLQATQTPSISAGKSILFGAIAGIGGGIVFGILMGMMNMLPMVGMLVGQESAAVGFVVHLLISAFIGATFGLLVTRLPNATLGTTVVAGALYGVVWWVLGALIFMPLMLGMNEMVLQIGSAQWMSLIGHILYGVVTALLLVPLSRRG